MSQITALQAIVLFLIFFLVPAILFRVPLAFCLGISSIVVLFAAGIPVSTIAQVSYFNLDNFTLLAILFFIVAGTFMEHSGISNSLIRWIESFIGRFRGAMGTICIVSSAAFGALTGSAISTLTAIGKIMIPQMTSRGYKKSTAAAIAAASCFLGIMIPPSTPGIVYSLTASCNLLKVWVSTIIPGLLFVVGYSFVNWMNRKKIEPAVTEPIQWGNSVRNISVKTQEAIWAIMMPVIIFGGIYGGIFTATEAGAVSLIYGFVYFVGKKYVMKQGLSKGLKDILIESTILSGKIALLLVFAAAVGRMVAYTGVSTWLSSIVTARSGKFVFLLLVNVVLLIVGALMELNCGLLIMTPILLPAAEAFGIDPIHFGAIILVNLSVGLITPPFGLGLFIGSKLSDAEIHEVLIEILPYLGVCLLVILITTYCPNLIMFLPNLVK